MKVRRIARVALFLAVGFTLGALVFGSENFLERLFIDMRFLLVADLGVQENVSDAIAIVLMDSASEQKLGVPYGLKWRQFHPELIRKLDEAGAAIVVFDAMFYDQDAAYDPQLAAAVAGAGNVLAGEDGTLPTAASLRPAFLAIGDLKVGQLGGEPRFVRVPAEKPTRLTPLALLAVQNYEEHSGGSAVSVALGQGSRFWINYREPPAYFPTFSYADVLLPQDGRVRDISSGVQTPLSVFKGKIVFVGRDEGYPSTIDRSPFPNTLGRRYAGVYGHAYATDTILLNRPVARVSPWVDASDTLLMLAAFLLLMEVRPRKVRAAALALLPVAAFLIALVLFSQLNIWIGYAPLFVGFFAALVLQWVLVRISLATSLSRAVGFDPRLIEAFRREGEHGRGPVRKEVTILIADVRDYTRYVSSTDPAVASSVMSEYMRAMEQRITAHGGYINKFVGDEIVAVFGFPLSSSQSTLRAVGSAIGMLEELSRLVASWKERGLTSIERIGIGIDTGTVSFAEVGGRTRRQFDIIGDCINGASRIEHLTKEFKRRLLISEEVFRSLQSDDDLVGMFELVRTVPVRGQGERRIFGIAQ